MKTTSTPSMKTPLKAVAAAPKSKGGRHGAAALLQGRRLAGEDLVLIVQGQHARRPQDRLAEPAQAEQAAAASRR